MATVSPALQAVNRRVFSEKLRSITSRRNSDGMDGAPQLRNGRALDFQKWGSLSDPLWPIPAIETCDHGAVGRQTEGG